MGFLFCVDLNVVVHMRWNLQVAYFGFLHGVILLFVLLVLGSIAISLCGVGRDWSSRRLMSMYWSYVGTQTNIRWDGVM